MNETRNRVILALIIVFVVSFMATVIAIFNNSLEDDKQLVEETAESLPFETAPEYEETGLVSGDSSSDEEKIILENIPVVVPEIETQDFSYIVEAEDSAIYGDLSIETSRADFSGTGYVTGLDGETGNRILFYFYIPTVQHYDIIIRYASDSQTVNHITADGKKIGNIETDGVNTKFKETTLEGVFLNDGYIEIEVQAIDGNIDIDYIEINNNTYVYENEHNLMKELSNENASYKAKELMSYMTDVYGNGIITGQYASSPENKELELIKEITGRYPAIRFGTLTADDKRNTAEIKACEEWVTEKCGAVGLMWYWNDPVDNNTIYAEETDFNLANAVTNEDIALLDISELEDMYSNGRITKECLEIIKDIDEISKNLKILSDAEIPVLWRPLHEAGGKWYWWGSAGNEAYAWLWELLYTRQTKYHNLNNLIWVWNGQSKNYIIDESLYDIASVDVYEGDEIDYGSHFQQYKWLYMLTESKKIVALSECGTIPDINEIFRDNAMFSFFGLWYGEYITDENGNYSEKYTSKETLKNMYNSEGAVTLDEFIRKQIPQPTYAQTEIAE